jgi:hypothetical protein
VEGRVRRISDAVFHCLRGQDDRTITLAVTMGDVSAEGTQVFGRRRDGSLVAP